MPACYVPVCLRKKHNARKAVWFTKATVHWSNFCNFVDSINSQIILRVIRESKRKLLILIKNSTACSCVSHKLLMYPIKDNCCKR